MIYVHNPHPRSNVPGHQGCTCSHLLISVPSCRRPKLSRVGTTFSAITADRWVTSNLGRPTGYLIDDNRDTYMYLQNTGPQVSSKNVFYGMNEN